MYSDCPSCSVSAAGHSSIHPTAPAAAPGGSTTRAGVRVTRRVASLDRGRGAPLGPAHAALPAARRIGLAATARVTVTTAIAVSGTAAIVVIATASTIGGRGAPLGRGTARVTCRVNGGQVIGKFSTSKIYTSNRPLFSCQQTLCRFRRYYASVCYYP